MFESAIRGKYRFPFKGLISTEDLWDLSVRDLDSIFKTLNAQIKNIQEESLLDTKSNEDRVLDTKIQIIKYIVEVKQAEIARIKQARETKEQKQKILAIIANKQESELQGKSIEELTKMLNDFEA